MSGTAERESVLHVLRVLEETGIGWAALTHEPSLALGDAKSDIDVIVDVPAHRAADAVARGLVRLVPIADWAYDVGALTLFVAPPEGGHRVQLDIVHDPTGEGRYGFRSGVLLERRKTGDRWPTVTPVDSLLYEIRKRIVKRDAVRLGSLALRARELGLSSTSARIDEVFSPGAASTVRSALGGTELPPARRSFSHRVATVGRYRSRLGRPVGFWAHLEREDLPSVARSALVPLLPHVRFERCDHWRLGHPVWWATRVAPVRWRPGLVVSWGELSSGQLRPDLLIPNEVHSSDIVATVTKAMSRRLVTG